MLTRLVGAAFAAALAWVLAARWLQRRRPEPHWDWAAIDTSDLSFPEGFVWGVATSAHQVEGGCDANNWSRWEAEPGRIADGHRSGAAADHWNRFREDIGLMKALGVGAYRFSVEWSKIEPAPGEYDAEAIAHYHEVIGALREAGIRPMATLHHFTHPLWFEDLGSFERAENLSHLVRFAERMFAEYGDRVDLWCTINEPAVVAAIGWFQGTFPPGRKDPGLTGEVLANLVDAHAQMYRAIKAAPGGDRVQVGLVKNVFQFDPLRRYNLLDWQIASALEQVFNAGVFGALRTGRFQARVPGMMRVDREIPEAKGSLDFLGLNYYSHFHVRFRPNPAEPFALVQRPGDVQTDMPYPIYAEGFHRALHRAAGLGVPIWVTENGIADARDDRRALFVRRYLYALSRAIAEGVDVRGYFYWSLMDNFEWAEGWHMKFGLYALDPQTQERTLREGARAYAEIVARFGGAPPGAGS